MTEIRQAFVCGRPRLDHSQGSLVFINACFALALGGLFYVATKSLELYQVCKISGSQFTGSVAWLLLAGYLVFVVWLQYSTYVIPLQQVRNVPEPLREQIATFSVTAVLAVIGISCVSFQRWTLPWLGILIFLNLHKVQQMRRVLLDKLPVSMPAVMELEYKCGLLRINLFFLALVIVLLFAWEQYLPDLLYSVLGVGLSVLLNYLARKVYSGFYPAYREQPSIYIEAILRAFEE